jgi:hypothetical protein
MHSVLDVLGAALFPVGVLLLLLGLAWLEETLDADVRRAPEPKPVRSVTPLERPAGREPTPVVAPASAS